MTRTDLAVLAVLVFGAVLLLLARPLVLGGGNGRFVQIEEGGRVLNRLPMPPSGEKRVVAVELTRGRAVVDLTGDGARIRPMPRWLCPRGICSHQGWIRREGESLICAPNRLVVRVLGGSTPATVDAVAR